MKNFHVGILLIDNNTKDNVRDNVYSDLEKIRDGKITTNPDGSQQMVIDSSVYGCQLTIDVKQKLVAGGVYSEYSFLANGKNVTADWANFLHRMSGTPKSSQ